MSTALPRLCVLAALLASAAGCGNPVTDNAIEAWGGELPDVPAGEHHRPGQPCVLCHSVAGGASPEMVLGGTVFADQQSFVPVEGAKVIVFDSVGDRFEMTTNCIGNFYLPRDDRAPLFPLAVEVHCPTYDASGEKLEVEKVVSMNSWISRDGSCATCHALTGVSDRSTGWVYCNGPDEIASNPYPPVSDDCPGKPPQSEGDDGGGDGDGMGSGMGNGMGGTP